MNSNQVYQAKTLKQCQRKLNMIFLIDTGNTLRKERKIHALSSLPKEFHEGGVTCFVFLKDKNQPFVRVFRTRQEAEKELRKVITRGPQRGHCAYAQQRYRALARAPASAPTPAPAQQRAPAPSPAQLRVPAQTLPEQDALSRFMEKEMAKEDNRKVDSSYLNTELFEDTKTCCEKVGIEDHEEVWCIFVTQVLSQSPALVLNYSKICENIAIVVERWMKDHHSESTHNTKRSYASAITTPTKKPSQSGPGAPKKPQRSYASAITTPTKKPSQSVPGAPMKPQRSYASAITTPTKKPSQSVPGAPKKPQRSCAITTPTKKPSQSVPGAPKKPILKDGGWGDDDEETKPKTFYSPFFESSNNLWGDMSDEEDATCAISA